jgi:hypothetical protein
LSVTPKKDFVQKMAKISRITLLPIISILATIFAPEFTNAQFTINIDNSAHLTQYGSNDGCTYFESDADIDCKYSPPVTPNQGFWSSCDVAFCELVVNVGQTGGVNSIASRLEVLGFAKGNSHIRVRYQLTPASSPVNLNPTIEGNLNWTNTVFNLNPLLGWTTQSVLLVRLNSEFFEYDIDVVDKVKIDFAELLDVLDSVETMGEGWTFNCAYHTNYADLPCPTMVTIPSGNQTGFWGSCGQYCALSYSFAAKPWIPTSVTISSFVAGYARLDVWVRVDGVLKPVGQVQDTTWTDTTFSLTGLGLDESSEILFEPFSSRYPHHVDLIDKITIKFALSA